MKRAAEASGAATHTTAGYHTRTVTRHNWQQAVNGMRLTSVAISDAVSPYKRVNSGGYPSLNLVPGRYKTDVLHPGSQSQAVATDQEDLTPTAAPRLWGRYVLLLVPNYQTTKGHANPRLQNSPTTADARGSRRSQSILHNTHLSDCRQQNRILCCRWYLGNVLHHSNQARPSSIPCHILPGVQA